MIEISEGKVSKMSEYAEKMLKYGGMLMECIYAMEEDAGMGHRGGSYSDHYNERSMSGRYNMRSEYYGERDGMGYRDEEDWDEDEMMGQRRGRGRRRDSRGRYM